MFTKKELIRQLKTYKAFPKLGLKDYQLQKLSQSELLKLQIKLMTLTGVNHA